MKLQNSIEELRSNFEQFAAVHERGHCVLLAGPGSGKTKTLTVAMARALAEDVAEPRGIACITYNNECASELESRLTKIGVEPSSRTFIGTIHSFALTQIIMPYAKCAMPELPIALGVASIDEQHAAIERAYEKAIGQNEDPRRRWKFAEEKRRSQVNRDLPEWREKNPELADFIEAYEEDLHSRGLIDFDDMPLIALRMARENEWIRKSILAKFPVLFVDEYQDLGKALHELVILLCFETGIRLFAVGDPDQSMYGFLGANPELLLSLSRRDDVKCLKLRFNYRCGQSIIKASIFALGEERDYRGPDNADQGTVAFHGIDGPLSDQARFTIYDLVPKLIESGHKLGEIAILYRSVKEGKYLSDCAKAHGTPIVRADSGALVKRSSKIARFLEACAAWQIDGWKSADPPFYRLTNLAKNLVYGYAATENEREIIESDLINFLKPNISKNTSTNDWLNDFNESVIYNWKRRSITSTEDWTIINYMIEQTEKSLGKDIDLGSFSGKVNINGRLNLSTLHSAKGREFDVAILFGMNSDIIPNGYENTFEKRKEPRRLFYVGLTRARKEVRIIYQKRNHSLFLPELVKKLQEGNG